MAFRQESDSDSGTPTPTTPTPTAVMDLELKLSDPGHPGQPIPNMSLQVQTSPIQTQENRKMPHPPPPPKIGPQWQLLTHTDTKVSLESTHHRHVVGQQKLTANRSFGIVKFSSCRQNLRVDTRIEKIIAVQQWKSALAAKIRRESRETAKVKRTSPLVPPNQSTSEGQSEVPKDNPNCGNDATVIRQDVETNTDFPNYYFCVKGEEVSNGLESNPVILYYNDYEHQMFGVAHEEIVETSPCPPYIDDDEYDTLSEEINCGN